MKKYLSIAFFLVAFYQCDPNYEPNEHEITRDVESGNATGKRQHG